MGLKYGEKMKVRGRMNVGKLSVKLLIRLVIVSVYRYFILMIYCFWWCLSLIGGKRE